jgi:hypothetical protein
VSISAIFASIIAALAAAITALVAKITGDARKAGKAQAEQKAATDALNTVSRANDARAEADRSNASPDRLRDNDGFRRD